MVVRLGGHITVKDRSDYSLQQTRSYLRSEMQRDPGKEVRLSKLLPSYLPGRKEKGFAKISQLWQPELHHCCCKKANQLQWASS